MAKGKNGAPAKNGQAPTLGSFMDSPFIKVQKEANQHSDLRRHLIEKIEDLTKAKTITFFSSFSKQASSIIDDDAEMLEGILAAEHKGGKLLMVINSPGGQALAAERIVNVCRSYSNMDFEVLVPHMAKSAATMICFGAALIHMSPTAELGPVDPQVPYWLDGQDPEGDPPRWISAEEYIRSYDTLVTQASNGKVKRLEPFIQQLTRYDARFIEQLRSVQRLSEEISVRLLHSLMMKGKSEKAIKKSIDVFLSQKRTSSHGRMITGAEALTCGLKVKPVDLHSELWRVVWELYVRSEWAVESTRSSKIIETSLSALSAA
jgi:hypothetical protein